MAQNEDNIAATNTLIFTNLTPEILLNPIAMYTLVPKAQVSKLVSLQSFKRILLVFHKTHDAQAIKEKLHNKEFMHTILKVYYCKHTTKQEFLKVPEKHHNFLLSPPSNPPVGWIQELEKEPSKGGLMKQLSNYSLMDFQLDGGVVIDEHIEDEIEEVRQKDGLDAPYKLVDGIKVMQSDDSLVYDFGDNTPTVIVDNTPDYVPKNIHIPQTEIPK